MTMPTLEEDVTAFVEIQAAEVRLQRLLTKTVAEEVRQLVTTAIECLAEAKTSINRRRSPQAK